MLHIGKLIRTVFDSQSKPLDVEWFAKQLHCNRSNVYHIFKRPSMDAELLQRISVILKYDFFKHISRETQNMIRHGHCE